MGIFNAKRYPYTNFHELNLDWIIEKLTEISTTVEKLDETVNQQIPALQNAVMAVQNKLTNLQSQFDNFNANVDGKIADAVAGCNEYAYSLFVNERTYFNSKISDLRQELTEMINRATTYCRNPWTGEFDTVCNILVYLYNSFSADSLTVDEYDALELTANAYDTKQINAVDFDQKGKLILM